MIIRISLVAILCLASFLHPDLNSAQKPLDSFQQELKARLAQRMKAMQAKLEKMPNPVIAKPAAGTPAPSQQDIKKHEARSAAQLQNAFWGTAQNVKKLWDELQKLLVDRKAGSWDEPNWKLAAYNRLGEIRDVDAVKISPALAQFLPDYIIAYGELSGNTRDILLKTADMLAAALFGNAPLSTEAQETLKKMIADLRQLSPKTLKLADIMKDITQARVKAAAPTATSVPAPKPTKNGDVKHEADIKKQKAEQCLEDLRKFYRDDLEQQRRDLMAIFYEITRKDEQQFLKYVKENRDRLITQWTIPELKKTKPLSTLTDFGAIIKRLLEQNNLNNILIRSNTLRDISASPLHISVDDYNFAYYSPITMEVTIIHEIQHILFDDAVTRLAMEDFLKQNPSKDNFLQLWNFFKEKRADIIAWLTSLEHIKADIDNYKRTPEQFLYKEDEHHISVASSIALAEALYKQMLSCYE